MELVLYLTHVYLFITLIDVQTYPNFIQTEPPPVAQARSLPKTKKLRSLLFQPQRIPMNATPYKLFYFLLLFSGHFRPFCWRFRCSRSLHAEISVFHPSCKTGFALLLFYKMVSLVCHYKADIIR